MVELLTNPASLGNAIKYDSRLLAICNLCANTVDLGLSVMVKKYGRDFPVPALVPKLKCTRCGSRSCAVQLALPEDKFA